MNRLFCGAIALLASALSVASQAGTQLSTREAVERLSPLAYRALDDYERELEGAVPDSELTQVFATQPFRSRYAAQLQMFCAAADNANNLACRPTGSLATDQMLR